MKVLKIIWLIFLISLACLGMGLSGAAIIPNIGRKEDRQKEKTELPQETVKTEEMAKI
ncbi:MAG: hypothetical protein ABIV51_08450 [Saprospiraceae bacterium]